MNYKKKIREFVLLEKSTPRKISSAENAYTCFELKYKKYSQKLVENTKLIPAKGPIATFYCDVPTEKVIFKGEQMHVRI